MILGEVFAILGSSIILAREASFSDYLMRFW